jgi:hypothetical protein
MIWIFATLCLGLIVYEFVALYRSRGETISEIFWRLSRRPLIPFAFGVLCGHLFWQACG